ncbi:MAG: AglZ/HisF2 family acetamidino modification protein [Verrucomicrobiales bacterium]
MPFVRAIPCLLLRRQGLVKTVKFSQPRYVGDPINTVRIFNEKEVDELVFLDITATPDGHEPQFDLVEGISKECYMPFAYGGGLQTVEQVKRILGNGAEKAVINSAVHYRPALITEAANLFGSQSVVVSVDVKRGWLGKLEVVVNGGRQRTGADPISYARRAVELGAGELLVTSVDRDGTFEGYDLPLISQICSAVSVPVVACGGAGQLDDLRLVVTEAGASAAAAGSLFVYQGPHRAVLINYPDRHVLDEMFELADRASGSTNDPPATR